MMIGRDAGMTQNLTLLIRDDDICHATPVWAMAFLREQVWAARPINFSVIPYTRPDYFLKSASAFCTDEADFVWNNQPLSTYLESVHRDGLLGLAMHGWTHQSQFGRLDTREFSTLNVPLLETVVSGFDWFDSVVGYKMFVPPHNDIHCAAEAYLHARDISVCRSIRDDEVTRLADKRGATVSRSEAKRILGIQPHGWPFTLFQSLIFNKEKLRSDQADPVELSRCVLAASGLHGLGVLTFHWWDFFFADGKPDFEFIQFVQRFFSAIEDSVAVTYAHYGDLIDQLPAHRSTE
jgi:hypothetical protein